MGRSAESPSFVGYIPLGLGVIPIVHLKLRSVKGGNDLSRVT